ncbi:WW domain-binding protein 4 [Leuresthes tenuis]|uniref:WW domain-binding protein 4 n=1 Tax=Leuresthes tenuis TaxID=355514 RepID=UPI003B50D161
MADYWKSQPRKFCQYCKCWIADNKPSVEFHERGKNHKENVAAKISEIKKKSIDKAKQEERASKQFAAMEEAALKAYQEDLKRMERESEGSSSPAPAGPQPEPQVGPQPRVGPQLQVGPQPKVKAQPKKQQRKEQKASRKFREQTGRQVWVEGLTDGGQTYFYNTLTKESQWEKPAGFQGEASSSAAAQPEQLDSSSGHAWMEAVSPDGYAYYYNTETGESSWEKPVDFPSKSAAKEEKETQEEPSAPEPEPLLGEESSNEASKEVQAPEQASQQPQVPKISFRKRPAEAEPSEKGEVEASDDPPKEEEKEPEKEAEVQSTTAEPEKTGEKVTPVGIRAKRPKGANPYGTWEQIKEEVDPYMKVDLQLPQVEGGTAIAPVEPLPEPKPKFKERIITSLGEEGGPASFRKNKTQNGKSRSLRQRDDADD